MAILHPEDRRGKEEARPRDWTIFDPRRHAPPRGVIASLDNLSGWTAETEGISGAFGVTPTAALWGEVGMFVDVAPAPAPGTITVRPPTPIPIPEGADLFELWVAGDVFDWMRRDEHFALYLLTRTAAGADERAIVMADPINWPTHSVRIIGVPSELRQGGVVTGLRLWGHDATRAHRFGLDRLCAYRDVRAPLPLAPRPRRPLTSPPEQVVGLYTGPGQLPFPTREETILPDNLTAAFTTRVERNGDTVRFCYAGEDVEIAYLWSPKEDAFRFQVLAGGAVVGEAGADAALGGAEVVHNFLRWLRARADASMGGAECQAFGPSPSAAGARPPAPRALPMQSLSLEGETASAIFDGGEFGPLTVRARLWAKSLVIDYLCPSGAVSVFDPGRFRGLANPRVRRIPAMHSNAVLLAETAGRTVFISHLHDWYRSNASYWSSRFDANKQEAVLQGPVTYLPTTAGSRNPLCERYFLTCSPVYEEVLPNIPNPPSQWAVEAGRYVFQESWGPCFFDRELAKAERWVAFGMNGILHLHHEAGWEYQRPSPAADEKNPIDLGRSLVEKAVRAGCYSDHCVNDGCTLRDEVSPHKGGNRAMRRFLAAEQALGLRAGLYTNYMDYYPLNPLFRSDWPILWPDGSRQPAWVHSYAMKPSLAVQFDAWFAPRIAQRFHPDTAYTDAHTHVAPWDRVDYDARAPGAGTFAATYYAWGELLLNDQRHYCGPVFSEGGNCHWMYAGLASGNYGLIGIRPEDAPDPAFNLLKVHPLQTDVGLSVGVDGWISGGDNLDEQVDRYLLGVLTCGHIAYLPEEPFDVRLLLRVYHMSRAASLRCAGRKPVAIHYQDDSGRWITVSEAHARGLGEHCRLRIRYPGEMALFANWSKTRAWTLHEAGSGETVLPPDGYILDTPQGVLCASVLVAGLRCDRAMTPEGWYLDGRGHEVRWGPLAASGSVALLTDPAEPRRRRLIDGGGNDIIRIEAPFGPRRYRALSPENKLLARRTATKDGTASVITAVAGAARYEWRDE